MGVGPLVSSQERRAAAVPQITRSSNARCVPLEVLFVRASEKLSGLLSSMPWKLWGASKSVVSWADRPVGVPSCPAPLRPATPPSAPPPPPARGMSGFWTRLCFPDMPCMQKYLQRRTGDDTLVSSQERRAPVIPQINRGSTARCVPPSVYIGFVWSFFRRIVQDNCLRLPWGARGSAVSWANRPVGVPSCPASPCPPPRRAPSHIVPPVVCPGFGSTNNICLRLRAQVLNNFLR